MLKIVGDKTEPYSTPLLTGIWFSALNLSPICVLLLLYIIYRYCFSSLPFSILSLPSFILSSILELSIR